ncbi:Asp-tRNA(Asn)/Glu-tRNA(Gln) amidotransferase subunit GatC [Candidatus Microgenomates bacterium]|nr:Asp-tRNA(Asn)/Glu-tRNA(Gln) amidotransferase subunit GatC [Candidatus Microgenomates bacterium]
MPLSQKDIEYAATLSRLELTDAEKEKFLTQLGSILGYFEKLNELDLEGVEPIYQVTGQENRLREDEVKNTENREELLQNSPEQEGGFIKVPKVL